MTKDSRPAETSREKNTIDRLATAQRWSALQGYLALLLLAAGIGLETGPGWGIAVLGLGLFADAWRDTTTRGETP